MGRGWTWFTRIGASGNELAGAAGCGGEGGSFAPGDREALTSVSAIFLPVLAAGGVRLGPRSVRRTLSVARLLRFRPSFCLLLLLFLITGFPAVGDLRQELANLFDVLIAPKANADAANPGDWRHRDFSGSDISLKTDEAQPQLFSGFAGGIRRHSDPCQYQIALTTKSRVICGKYGNILSQLENSSNEKARL